MANVLCATSNKHSRGEEDDGEVSKYQRPLTPTENHRAPESSTPDGVLPIETLPPTSYSRVEKLQTQLKLPDGREFALPTCVDLALNLLLNSFDRYASVWNLKWKRDFLWFVFPVVRIHF